MKDSDRIGILVAGRFVKERDTSTFASQELEQLYLRLVTGRASADPTPPGLSHRGSTREATSRGARHWTPARTGQRPQ